ncbi:MULTISPECIES: RNA polymerase sigma factor [unclassified Aureispira]|uniref:RNA polymerase sigma factor n=1 Tax=unclassified Aureispira TaxID=2649989 RepID=UPI000697B6E3|nr:MULTISPECIES: RNA polymerase sigma factor [unclassified Aureispira]WMX16753.1 RNA polymerase sigma factor [Aureispira sp. CCB-E]
MTEQELIERCKRNDRLAQKALYERFSSKMFGVCRRYVKTVENTEEVLMLAFCKVFKKIDTYSGNGSFEGWIRRVMVNESLMFLRKNYRFNEHADISELPVKAVEVNVEDELAAQDILNLLEQLPTGYRTVFNLYVIEGFKHREIAEQLGISINTSKSQLILAKKKLQEMIKKSEQLGSN